MDCRLCVILGAITRREITRFLRIWTQTLLPSAVTMSLYFVIFGNLIGPRIGKMQGITYIDYIVPGLIMMSILTNSYSNVATSFFSSKFQKNIEEMIVAPMPSVVMLLGFIAGGITRGLFVGVIVTAVAMFFTDIHIHSLLFVFLVGLLTSILFALAGLINAIFAQKFDDINMIPTFVLTPLTYLGGVFYSIDMLPPFGQWCSHANPIFYMVNAFRYGFLGITDIDITFAMSVILLFSVVFFTFAWWLLEKGIGIRT